MSETFRTPLTELFGIKVPILLAGMNVAAGTSFVFEIRSNAIDKPYLIQFKHRS